MRGETGERERRIGVHKKNHKPDDVSKSVKTMGSSASTTAAAPLPEEDRDVLGICTGHESFPYDHPLWARVLAFRHPLHLTDPGQIHLATRAYCERMGALLTEIIPHIVKFCRI